MHPLTCAHAGPCSISCPRHARSQEVGSQATAELCSALPGLLGSDDTANKLGEFSETIGVLVSITDFRDFKMMMASRARERQNLPEASGDAAKRMSVAGDSQRDAVDAVLKHALGVDHTLGAEGPAWKVLASTQELHCETRKAASGKTEFRTTMTLDLPIADAAVLMTDFSAERCAAE